MNKKKSNSKKAVMIGCGFVGSASVFALMQSGLFTEIALIDADKNKAEGEAMDISHGIPFASPMKIYAGDYDDVADAAIVIISAGAGQKPGETRLDLVNKNVAIFKSIIPEITKRDFGGILLVVANPVDILTQVAIKLSGLPEERVIGSGTVLDSASVLGYTDETISKFFYKALFAIGMKDWGMDKLLPIVLEVGKVNLRCMELLDQANTTTYGTPVPTTVPLTIEKGPFIIITGHDLKDLQLLLEQTKDKGINIYTHGEMLPAHAYPELKKYSHLKGNFGTAWQNQQKEFDNIPGAILYTTNCLMPVKPTYADRVFTTEVVSYPEIVHIGEEKDFTPVIEKALALGGYTKDQHMTGINGGIQVTTGFSHGTVLSVADQVIEAVKNGDIKHFFLVGGCDGARVGRNYYTEFVKQSPADSIILTLACGKYRFNDLDLGTIGGLPRIMDMGQCNDAYSAIKVAIALAEAFECDVNELPLSMVLSWYEQKAVCILLTLLYLGIKNIHIGPTLPAFISPNVLNFLVENYGLSPIGTPEEDIKKLLNK